MNQHVRRLLLISAMLWLPACGPGMGGGVMMPMGVGMMPMGGYAYGGGWGHSTQVAVYNNRTTDVYAARRDNTAVVSEGRGDMFYHPGRFR